MRAHGRRVALPRLKAQPSATRVTLGPAGRWRMRREATIARRPARPTRALKADRPRATRRRGLPTEGIQTDDLLTLFFGLLECAANPLI